MIKKYTITFILGLYNIFVYIRFIEIDVLRV